jgi:MFS family permease
MASPTHPTRPTRPVAPPPIPAYAWYAIAVLTLANVSSFLDRQILTLLVGPIRRDLHISDTEMSLLLGLSFAIFYALLGFPIARLADQKSRKWIVAIGAALWSVTTTLAGLAKNFGHLFLARIGVGVGEATLNPPAHSLIADSVPRERLGTALGVYSMGIYLGVALAQLIGGAVVAVVGAEALWRVPLVGEVRPWQVVFFVVGLPGLLIALLAITIREPPRRGGSQPIPVRDVLLHFRGNARTVLLHHLGLSLIALVNYGFGGWLPTFFVRTYGWTASQAGYVLGLGNLTFGLAGVMLAGRVADVLQARGIADAKMRVVTAAALGLLVCDIAAPLMPTGTLAAIWIFPLSFFASAPFGVGAAAVQDLVPDRMRAQASALYLFVMNLVGLAIGPSAVALATDYLFRDDSAVRYSLVLVAGAALAPAILLLLAGFRPFRESVSRMTAR